MSGLWIPSIISAVGALVVILVQLGIGRRNDERIEHLRSQLALATDRRKSIYERRARVLADVYAKLVDAREAYEDFLRSGTRFSTSPGPEECHRNAMIAGEEFRKAYTRNRIIIPGDLAARLDAMNQEFVTIAKTFIAWRASGMDENSAYMKVYEKTGDDIQSTLSDLHNAFVAAIESRE